MVQTRRARRVATAPLLRLPAEILRKIASTSVSPGLARRRAKTSRRGRHYARARTRPSDRASAASASRCARRSTSCGRGIGSIRTRLARVRAARPGGRSAGRTCCAGRPVKDWDHPDSPEREDDLRWEFSIRTRMKRAPAESAAVYFTSERLLRDGVVQDDDRVRRGPRRAERAGAYTPLHYWRRTPLRSRWPGTSSGCSSRRATTSTRTAFPTTKTVARRPSAGA